MSTTLPDASFSLEPLRTRKLSSETAWSLALASQLAGQSDEARGIALSEWGFSAGEIFEQGPSRGFLAASGGVILLALAPKDATGGWNGGNAATTERPHGEVNAAAFAVFAEVSELIRTALRIVYAEDKFLWVTGHGLGGATAIIAASELDDEFRVTGVYTFNPVCAGKIPFADRFDSAFLGRSFRFEAGGDQTFSVPPGFRQVQQLVRLDLGEAAESDEPEGGAAGSMDRCLARLKAQAETERLKRRNGDGTPKRGTPQLAEESR